MRYRCRLAPNTSEPAPLTLTRASSRLAQQHNNNGTNGPDSMVNESANGHTRKTIGQAVMRPRQHVQATIKAAILSGDLTERVSSSGVKPTGST